MIVETIIWVAGAVLLGILAGVFAGLYIRETHKRTRERQEATAALVKLAERAARLTTALGIEGDYSQAKMDAAEATAVKRMAQFNKACALLKEAYSQGSALGAGWVVRVGRFLDSVGWE